MVCRKAQRIKNALLMSKVDSPSGSDAVGSRMTGCSGVSLNQQPIPRIVGSIELVDGACAIAK